MGFRFQCDGSSHSPTSMVVRPFGSPNSGEVGNRIGRTPPVQESAAVSSFSAIRCSDRGIKSAALGSRVLCERNRPRQIDDGLDNQNRRKTNREPGISARFFLLSVAFIALDDSVTLDSDLGVRLSSLVITTPLLIDLILLSERGQDIAKLADLLADQARHRFFAMFAPPFLIPVQGVECKQHPHLAIAQPRIEYHFVWAFRKACQQRSNPVCP